MIKCVIIDDDDFAINSLKALITKINSIYPIEVITTYNNSFKAVEELKNNTSFNLLFIDYEMPGYNGIEVVKQIGQDVAVIFVTSHTELSKNIINEVNIIGFLSKPAKQEDLEKILKKKDLFSKKTTNFKKRIIIPNGKKENLFFNPDNIYYIESDGKYKDIYGAEKGALAKNIVISFNELEHILSPSNGFKLISKKYMVNVNKIKKTEPSGLELINSKFLTIGDTKKTSFKKFIKRFFKV